MRQPSLFNFKPTEQLRHSGFTPEEERGLVGFCLSDDYPREYVVERTGTRYRLLSEQGARRLLTALRYGNKELRTAVTTNQMRLR